MLGILWTFVSRRQPGAASLRRRLRPPLHLAKQKNQAAVSSVGRSSRTRAMVNNRIQLLTVRPSSPAICLILSCNFGSRGTVTIRLQRSLDFVFISANLREAVGILRLICGPLPAHFEETSHEVRH